MISDAGKSGRIQWGRLLAEGVVIVGSILLAFAIDAWWDTARDAAAASGRLDLLADQNMANHDGLVRADERLGRALEAMDALIYEIGPRPEPLTQDSLAELMGASFSYGDFDVELSAVEEILSSGQLDTELLRDLHERLLAFRAGARYYGDQVAFLLERREEVVAHLIANAAFGSLLSPIFVGDTTVFPVPVERILSDERLEGLLLNLRVRTGTARQRGRQLVIVSDSIRVLLDRP